MSQASWANTKITRGPKVWPQKAARDGPAPATPHAAAMLPAAPTPAPQQPHGDDGCIGRGADHGAAGAGANMAKVQLRM